MKQKYVSPVFLSNGTSSTLVIPKDIAVSVGINKPCHVTLQEKNDTIVIKKLKL